MLAVRVPKLRVGIALAGLAAVASAPMVVTALGERGVEVPGLAVPQNLLSILAARSPGERQKGELSATKRVKESRQRAFAKADHPRLTPAEQLGRLIVAPPTATPTPIAPPLAPPTIAEVIVPAAPFAAPLIASLGPVILGGGAIGGGGGGAVDGTPGGGGSGGGGGGGGGDGGGGTAPPDNIAVTPPPTPVTSAVPEPASWAMMLLGFAAIGTAMRRERRAAPILQRG